jgi:hypothetical protein
MDSTVLKSPDTVVDKVVFALSRQATIAEQIRHALPVVKQRSGLNFDVIAKAAQR